MFRVKSRLPASTLIETIVSSVILLISYSFLLIVFLHFSKGNDTEKVFSANMTIENIFKNEHLLSGFEKRTMKVNNMIFDINVVKYENLQNCYLVKVNVFKGDRKFLFTRQRIIGDVYEKRK